MLVGWPDLRPSAPDPGVVRGPRPVPYPVRGVSSPDQGRHLLRQVDVQHFRKLHAVVVRMEIRPHLAQDFAGQIIHVQVSRQMRHVGPGESRDVPRIKDAGG